MALPSAGARFRNAMTQKNNDKQPLQIVGTINAYTAMMATQVGHQALYLSGAGVANASFGLPDLGMTSLDNVLEDARRITDAVDTPLLVDIDTGFGETMSVARTIKELTYLGIAGCHIEDQVNPKRCGHLDNKELVSIDDMVKKIKAASDAKIDPNFLLIARTDARGGEGLEAAIDRAKAYVDAGAEMIFPEALNNESEFEAFRKALWSPA